MNKERGHIILLNGTSSSGKSTLAKEIIKVQPEYFHLSVDEYAYFIDMVEAREDKRLIPVETYYYFHRNIAMFSNSGVKVIVDTVFDEDISKKDFWKCLDGYPILSVGVHCPENILNIREKDRGDRRIGQALNQIKIVHEEMKYDVLVNTHTASTEENVKRIIDSIS